MSDNVVLNYMSDLEIVDFIQNYIDKSSYNYAVLIDGSWGSGKTFLLENTIIPSIKKNQELNKRKGKKVIYISLYGITTKDELTRQIWIETVAFSKVLKSKSFKIASSIGKVALGGALSSQGVSLPGFYIDKDMFMSLEKCILIFDDLERCSMDVNVILGYINNFVEHDGIKVIIVANEKEIATTRLSSNKEFKYLVALNHDIDFTESKENNQLLTSDFTNKQKTDLNTKINLNELSTKVKLLFGQDDSYKQIKEKLIGVTIHYKPNIDVIIDKIVQNNIDSEAIRSIIIRNKYFIIEKLDFYMHQNIRTIMFCIDKFNILSKCIIDEFSFKDSEKVLNDIFRYIVTISIKYKTGKSLPKWEDNSEIEQVSVSGESLSFYDGIKGFKFVDDFISETKFNKVRVLDVIRRHLVILKNDVKDPNDPLFMLSNNWFSMEEDSDVVNLLACVNIALTEEPNKYNISSYSNIIYLNITLNRVGVVSTDISKILQRMKDNIKLFHVDTTFNIFGWGGYPFDDDSDSKLYEKCIEDLNAQRKRNKEVSDEKDLNAIFDNTDAWIKQLEEYVLKNKNKLLEQKAFISKLDFNKLLNSIKHSSNKDILIFRSIISDSVYNFSNINEFYSEDKRIIDMLCLELERYVDNIKETQKIKTSNVRYLIRNLKDISKKLTI